MSEITVASHGRVALVTLTNPPRGYFDNDGVVALHGVLDRLERDAGVGALVFTGGLPGVFIRHYDVAEIRKYQDILKAKGPLPAAAPDAPTIFRLFDRLEQGSRPAIAAINGLCMGGGFEFALACDLRVIEDGPHAIGLPEIRIGIFPGAGGTQRLPRLIGEARTLDLILRGRVLPPREALSWGLVHEVVSTDVVGRALAIGAELATRAPQALAAIKRLVRTAHDRPLAEGLADEARTFARLLIDEPASEREMNRFLATGEEIRD